MSLSVFVGQRAVWFFNYCLSIEERFRMTKLIITRHGHVVGIDPIRFHGRADLSLTMQGEAQVKAVAERISWQWKPVAVYTSPLCRCVATGNRITAACGVRRK